MKAKIKDWIGKKLFAKEHTLIDFLSKEHRREFELRVKAETALHTSKNHRETLMSSCISAASERYARTKELMSLSEAHAYTVHLLRIMNYLEANRATIAKEASAQDSEIQAQQDLFDQAQASWTDAVDGVKANLITPVDQHTKPESQ